MKKLLLILIVITLFGCATSQQSKVDKTKEIMNSWMGSHKSDVILAWGPPTRYASDGSGGDILVYEKSQTVGAVISGVYHQRTSYPYQMFYTDDKGYVYYWKTGNR